MKLLGGEVVAVNVSSLAGFLKQLFIVHAIEKAYVVDLGLSRQEELNGSH